MSPMILLVKCLITVGRFAPEKGYDLLAQLAQRVLPKYPDWQWDIYGTGSLTIKSALENALVDAGVFQVLPLLPPLQSLLLLG